MNYDKFGRAYTTSDDLADMLYQDPELPLENFHVTDPENYNDLVKRVFYVNFPELRKYQELEIENVEDFDAEMQNQWYMPEEYKTLDIAEWLLNQCKADYELQRVGEELLLYQERDLFNLLRYMKYMVDTFRNNYIVWGLGRGSSVASYVLYLIGVHKINSIYYDLNIDEFLR
jgi:DNA polymerase III alpha subunit